MSMMPMASASYGKSWTLVPKLTTTPAPATRTPPRTPQPTQGNQQPLPTEHTKLKLEAIQKQMEWNRARKSGGKFGALMALLQWLTARLNLLRPMRAFRHYTLHYGPLMSAGIGFNMFFSVTGLLATGFSIAGLVLSGQPALLQTIIGSVSSSAPGLLKVNGGPGLVDPKDLLDPNGLGWTAVI